MSQQTWFPPGQMVGGAAQTPAPAPKKGKKGKAPKKGINPFNKGRAK